MGHGRRTGRELANFWISIQNDGVAADTFKVKRSGFFHDGYKVRYIDANGVDVTGKVNVGSFTTPPLARRWRVRDACRGQGSFPFLGRLERDASDNRQLGRSPDQQRRGALHRGLGPTLRAGCLRLGTDARR